MELSNYRWPHNSPSHHRGIREPNSRRGPPPWRRDGERRNGSDSHNVNEMILNNNGRVDAHETGPRGNYDRWTYSRHPNSHADERRLVRPNGAYKRPYIGGDGGGGNGPNFKRQHTRFGDPPSPHPAREFAHPGPPPPGARSRGTTPSFVAASPPQPVKGNMVAAPSFQPQLRPVTSGPSPIVVPPLRSSPVPPPLRSKPIASRDPGQIKSKSEDVKETVAVLPRKRKFVPKQAVLRLAIKGRETVLLIDQEEDFLFVGVTQHDAVPRVVSVDGPNEFAVLIGSKGDTALTKCARRMAATLDQESDDELNTVLVSIALKDDLEMVSENEICDALEKYTLLRRSSNSVVTS